MLYRSTDRSVVVALCRCGAPMQNLAHSASFESLDKDAPSKAETKHLGPIEDAKGASMSIKLTDTQLVLLGAAAQRKDLCLVAPPTLKGATAQKVASKLISAGFVKEVKAKASDPIWRRDQESGGSYALKLTAAGAKEIAVDDAAGPVDAGQESDALANRDQAAILSKLDAKDARPSEAMEP